MLPTFHNRFDARRQRSLVVAAIGVSLVMGMLGMPEFRSVQKFASSPFPCQHHRCGCRDAVSCWQSCCCFNDEEKLAWAQERGVTPPASFLEKISAKNLFRPQRPHAKAPAEQRRLSPSACCSLDACAPHAQGDELVFVVVEISALRCCVGLERLCKIFSSAVCVPTNTVRQTFDRQVARVCLPTTACFSMSYEPITPPPRLHVRHM